MSNTMRLSEIQRDLIVASASPLPSASAASAACASSRTKMSWTYDRWKTSEPEPQPERCGDCNGEGSLEIPDPQRDDPYYCHIVKCQGCDGNGWV